MTTRELINSTTVKVAVAVLSLGIAIGTLKAQLNAKADETEVTAMAREVHAVHVLVCRQYPNDSSCLGVQ